MGSFEKHFEDLELRTKLILPNFRATPRVREMRKLEGKYQTGAFCNWDQVPDLVRLLMSANQMDSAHLMSNTTPKGEKLGKWLGKSHVPEKLISDAFNAINKGTEFEITCKFSDIVRMSESPHYKSCLSNQSAHNHQKQRIFYLLDKYMGLIVVRDPKGEFLSRRVCSLAIRTIDNSRWGPEDDLVLRVNKQYGNGPCFQQIKKAIETKHPIKCVYVSANCSGAGVLRRPELCSNEMMKYFSYEDGGSANIYSISPVTD